MKTLNILLTETIRHRGVMFVMYDQEMLESQIDVRKRHRTNTHKTARMHFRFLREMIAKLESTLKQGSNTKATHTMYKVFKIMNQRPKVTRAKDHDLHWLFTSRNSIV